MLTLLLLAVLGVAAIMVLAMGMTTPDGAELAPIGNGFFLRRDAAAAFIEMRGMALLDGIELHVNSAWRSREEQARLRELYLQGKGNLASPPGNSSHELGTAIDIESAGGTNATYWWLQENAGRFGWENTGEKFSQREPWHWLYTGVKVTE